MNFRQGGYVQLKVASARFVYRTQTAGSGNYALGEVGVLSMVLVLISMVVGLVVTMLVTGAAILKSILSPLLVSLSRIFLHELRRRIGQLSRLGD